MICRKVAIFNTERFLLSSRRTIGSGHFSGHVNWEHVSSLADLKHGVGLVNARMKIPPFYSHSGFFIDVAHIA